MPRAKAAKPAGGAAKKGKGVYKLADPLPEGVILNDLTKGQWRTGKPIGVGGFGMIYLASPTGSGDKTGPSAEYVVKVEPKSNGPLFSELSFYQRVAKESQIAQFKSSKKLKELGMPRFVASGSHERGGALFRFMVMDRFGTDLQKLFEQNGKRFPDKTVFTLAIQVLDVLEFMHTHSYVHADIKASNMLLGFKKSHANQAFLVDFGLATKYTMDNKHKDYKEDPRRCHDGTIEFTSIDAHKGVAPSRRGDLEILGYCVVQWLCSQLPWEDKLGNPEYVRDQKIKNMKDIPGFMKRCSLNSYQEVEKYLKYVSAMGYDQQPDYNCCKKFFKDALKKRGLKEDGKLDFTSSATTKTTKKTTTKKRKSEEVNSVEEDTSSQDEVISPKRIKKTAQSRAKSKVVVKVKSPATHRASPAVSRVKSPVARSRASPVSRVKSPAARSSPSRNTKTAAAKSPVLNVNGKAKPRPKKKSTRPKASVGCQTSPHLKGLKRSRKDL